MLEMKSEPDRDTRRHDDEALEEIRRLFARYRRGARHGQVADRDEPDEARAEDADDATTVSGR